MSRTPQTERPQRPDVRPLDELRKRFPLDVKKRVPVKMFLALCIDLEETSVQGFVYIDSSVIRIVPFSFVATP